MRIRARKQRTARINKRIGRKFLGGKISGRLLLTLAGHKEEKRLLRLQGRVRYKTPTAAAAASALVRPGLPLVAWSSSAQTINIASA